MVGKPNPELERISGPQKVMLLFVAVGFVLIGLLALMPSRPHENEKTRRSGVAQASRIRKFIAASIACNPDTEHH